MLTKILDTDRVILLSLEPRDLISFICTCKATKNLTDDLFWTQKLIKFGVPQCEVMKMDTKKKTAYIRLFNQVIVGKKVSKGNLMDILGKQLSFFSKHGYSFCLDLALMNKAPKNKFESVNQISAQELDLIKKKAIRKAVNGGHVDCVKRLLRVACKNAIATFEPAIKMGFEGCLPVLDEVLHLIEPRRISREYVYSATKEALSLVVTHPKSSSFPQRAFIALVDKGDLELVKWMLTLNMNFSGSKISKFDSKCGVLAICVLNNNVEMLKYLISIDFTFLTTDLAIISNWKREHLSVEMVQVINAINTSNLNPLNVNVLTALKRIVSPSFNICKGITKKGKRCKKAAGKGKEYCNLHINQ